MNLWHGDCLELMKNIPDKSIDMVLTDPPYGTTACKWDVVIPFEPMWTELKRITKDNGAICLFGSEPFSSHLRLSNLKMFKYDWIWEKEKASNILNANRQVLKIHEIIHVFYYRQSVYFPQMVRLENPYFHKNRSVKSDNFGGNSKSYNENGYKEYTHAYPKSILKIKKENAGKGSLHSTQKPVALLEYLIKTYTLENETVLDFTMGSGSTGVACKNLNRNFIGIEKDETYFNIAKKRIEEA